MDFDEALPRQHVGQGRHHQLRLAQVIRACLAVISACLVVVSACLVVISACFRLAQDHPRGAGRGRGAATHQAALVRARGDLPRLRRRRAARRVGQGKPRVLARASEDRTARAAERAAAGGARVCRCCCGSCCVCCCCDARPRGRRSSSRRRTGSRGARRRCDRSTRRWPSSSSTPFYLFLFIYLFIYFIFFRWPSSSSTSKSAPRRRRG